MSRENVEAVLRFLARTDIPTLDITGGAPELHPISPIWSRAARRLGRHVMDRCNLTVIFEPGMEYLPEFFKRNRSRAGLFSALLFRRECRQTARQGHFRCEHPRPAAPQRVGYGQPDSDLILNLVYNPSGRTCRRRKKSSNKITKEFSMSNSASFSIILFCLTNMPITRYATHLKLRGEYDALPGIAGKQLQRRHSEPSDVPQSHQHRLGRLGVRLRFQSDARSARLRTARAAELTSASLDA